MPSKKTPKKSPAKTPKKTPGKTPGKTPRNSPVKISGKISEKTPERTPKKTPKKLQEKSATTDSPYVSTEKLKEALEVLKKLSEIRNEEKKGKIALFEDDSQHLVKLQIVLKKIPYNKTTFVYFIDLPNHWRHEMVYETCLIVKDLSKKPLTDRELDLDQTKSHYKELLSKDNSDQLVNEILPMRELRNEYKVFEAKQKLGKAFNAFICERTLLHNKFDYLSRFLGKTFWLDQKNVPIPIDLTSTSLRNDLESKLNQTSLYLSGKGDTSIVTIGLLKQSTEKLAQNLLAVNKKLLKQFSNNVRSLSVKTDKSIAITFFLDCGFISDIKMEKNLSENTPIEGDFSHFLKSNVQIFKGGDIKVVPKPPEEIKEEEDIDEIETKWLLSNKKTKNRKRRISYRLNTNRNFKRRKNNTNNIQKTE